MFHCIAKVRDDLPVSLFSLEQVDSENVSSLSNGNSGFSPMSIGTTLGDRFMRSESRREHGEDTRSFDDGKREEILACGFRQPTSAAARGSSVETGTSLVRANVGGLALGEIC